ncbi:protein kinase [Streptomyces longwoodensis]|uniref:protein kinase domain-containing protein n=1 Tax=Streptomyces longwoodensis TaxID=68231 RepID=UPI002E800B64|nr:protein kinase [Streptomyces longwoodensis]WUC56783.1 protein kinase [Streptomyces longwoodensis]
MVKWGRRKAKETSDTGDRPSPPADTAAAEQAGRRGDAAEAVSRYGAAVAEAARQYGPEAVETLAVRHQLAHWTGESGHPEQAVELFARLLADRERLQGPHHPDSELARHQLAHWYGRAGRFQEAVNRYEIMRRVAVQQGRPETALSLMCEVGYWQHQAGDTAAALRTFAEMLRGAQQELGPTHQLTGIARQRYAELAAGLPFGNEGGHDGLQNLIAAAAEVEASGDFRRAGRLYGQIAAQSEDLYGHASAQTLSALVAQAKAAVNAGDHAEAAERFDAVLACMALQGRGPGTREYDILLGQREELARSAAHVTFRIGQHTGTLLGQKVQAAPQTACGVLARRPETAHATCVAVVLDETDSRVPAQIPAEQWSAVIRHLAKERWEATAVYFARPDRRPRAAEAQLCRRLGLLGVYVSCMDSSNVQVEAYAFTGSEPVYAPVVVVPEESAAPEQATARLAAGGVTFHPGAEAFGQWREVGRVRPATDTEGPSAFGGYDVLERVGRGGFGDVYLCQDPDGVMVAVKTLHARYANVPSVRQGFAHEVQAAQRVSGRFTVPVIAADPDGDTPWMAVPYVAAPSLQELLEQSGKLDEPTVRGLGAGIAAALSAIHAQGIVHLDLKPGNVLLTADGPRVIDFGIAQIERLTEPRRGFAGTYTYASPEQLREQPVFTAASDVFSLGTVLARLALGRSPWGGDTATAVANIRAGTPDLHELPSSLLDVVRSCLQLDPARRPTPHEVAEALQPGVANGDLGPLPLSQEAQELVAAYATMPATRLYETLADTRARAAAEGDVAPTRALSTGALTAPVADSLEGEGVRRAMPFRDTAPARSTAAELEARIHAWEQEAENREMAQTRHECGEFMQEARTLLGAAHPLTLRLRVSHAMLGCDQPGGVANAERVVGEAVKHLGEAHPTVRDARVLLEMLKSTGGT